MRVYQIFAFLDLAALSLASILMTLKSGTQKSYRIQMPVFKIHRDYNDDAPLLQRF